MNEFTEKHEENMTGFMYYKISIIDPGVMPPIQNQINRNG